MLSKYVSRKYLLSDSIIAYHAVMKIWPEANDRVFSLIVARMPCFTSDD